MWAAVQKSLFHHEGDWEGFCNSVQYESKGWYFSCKSQRKSSRTRDAFYYGAVQMIQMSCDVLHITRCDEERQKPGGTSTVLSRFLSAAVLYLTCDDCGLVYLHVHFSALVHLHPEWMDACTWWVTLTSNRVTTNNLLFSFTAFNSAQSAAADMLYYPQHHLLYYYWLYLIRLCCNNPVSPQGSLKFNLNWTKNLQLEIILPLHTADNNCNALLKQPAVYHKRNNIIIILLS